jgi:predicted transcriptional regulator
MRHRYNFTMSDETATLLSTHHNSTLIPKSVIVEQAILKFIHEKEWRHPTCDECTRKPQCHVSKGNTFYCSEWEGT